MVTTAVFDVYRFLGVVSGGQRPLGAHLANEDTASAQGPAHCPQTTDHPGTRDRVGVDHVGPGRDLEQPPWRPEHSYNMDWGGGVTHGPVPSMALNVSTIINFNEQTVGK